MGLLLLLVGHAASATPLAGVHDGVVYARTADDSVRVHLQGRAHLDATSDFGASTSFFLRRARLELSGEVLQRWCWYFSLNLGPNREQTAMEPSIADAYASFAAAPGVNLSFGQALLPITYENRVGSNMMSFLERSLPVRALGTPTLRDIGLTVWGIAPSRRFAYWVSIVNGDGPNRANADTRFDGVARVLVRPSSALQLGVSARAGSRDRVAYDLPNLTTEGGYAYFKSTYRDLEERLVRIMPSDSQRTLDVDAFVPIGPVDWVTEILYAREETRESIDGRTERRGTREGVGWYTSIGVWVLGDRSLVRAPAIPARLHLRLDQPEPPARHGLEILGKFEQLRLDYRASDREGRGGKSARTSVDALTFAINYWATRHVRVSASYMAYFIGGEERARHELHARVGVQF